MGSGLNSDWTSSGVFRCISIAIRFGLLLKSLLKCILSSQLENLTILGNSVFFHIQVSSYPDWSRRCYGRRNVPMFWCYITCRDDNEVICIVWPLYHKGVLISFKKKGILDLIHSDHWVLGFLSEQALEPWSLVARSRKAVVGSSTRPSFRSVDTILPLRSQPHGLASLWHPTSILRP